jgi:hypothetical protein
MSAALDEWRGASGEVFDEIERMLWSVDGTRVGERTVAQQLNYAYAMLITAHFQRYCRDLHAETAQALVAHLMDPALGRILQGLLAQNRRLDKGNPTPVNLGLDFARFGFRFWDALEASDHRNKDRKTELERLCEWRNAIVHGDVARKRAEGRLAPRTLNLDTCREWRRALGSLAISTDRVISTHCKNLGCAEPW